MILFWYGAGVYPPLSLEGENRQASDKNPYMII